MLRKSWKYWHKGVKGQKNWEQKFQVAKKIVSRWSPSGDLVEITITLPTELLMNWLIISNVEIFIAVPYYF